MKTIYICTDSITGIFSAVYEAWKDRRREGASGIAIQGSVEPELFCEYREILEKESKAEAVERMILGNLGQDVYHHIYYAALSRDDQKGEAILGTLLAARKIRQPRKIMEHLGNSSVEKVFELSRAVGNEAHLLTGFVRFQELENGILFADITPKNQVLPCLGAHFQERFPLENWMIRDKNRDMFVVHESGRRWVLVQEEDMEGRLDARLSRLSDQEEEMQKLWREFCNTISIKERENPKCQRTHLPLRYRPNMTEFVR
uniref:TIGR03915 family putative DNA repair protein n=1 Tax=Lachnoclostridium phocaeense TaxID=1871021 RepID=UPI0026DBBBA1|nr:TIGR03915 family putative DNA repair protein [Lachnoclostridium phocaeense]